MSCYDDDEYVIKNITFIKVFKHCSVFIFIHYNMIRLNNNVQFNEGEKKSIDGYTFKSTSTTRPVLLTSFRFLSFHIYSIKIS